MSPNNDNLYSLLASAATSKVLAPEMKIESSSYSKLQVTLNLWRFLSQFFIGIIWINVYLALQLMLNVYSGLGG